MREDVAVQALGPGSTIGPWKVLHRLDSGSYGVVFLVERAGHPEAGLFALKLAKHPWDERFEREAQLLQLCQHPGIPRYEDMGVWTGPDEHRYPYIVMECVEGLTLYDWFREQPRTNLEVLQVLVQVARALDAVHAAGAVHRDVKGDNIRVTRERRAVLVDFGSGWMPGARPLTDTCAPPGTTPYRAPELLRFMWKFMRDDEARWHARPSDDLYALGVTAYRLVTGTYPPPVTETGGEAGRKLLRPRELATVTPELDELILRLLSEDREARSTARETAENLERAAQQAGPEVNRPIQLTPIPAPVDEDVPSSSSREPSRPSSAPVRLRSRSFSAWLSWASAAMVGGLLVALVEHHHRRNPVEFIEQESESMSEDWHAPAVDTPDAGVSEEALASAQPLTRSGVPTAAIGLPMPRNPFPWQRKPPCAPRTQRAINGGCWIGPIGTERPPCGPEAFDHDNGCYAPAYDTPRGPTSGQP